MSKTPMDFSKLATTRTSLASDRARGKPENEPINHVLQLRNAIVKKTRHMNSILGHGSGKPFTLEIYLAGNFHLKLLGSEGFTGILGSSTTDQRIMGCPYFIYREGNDGEYGTPDFRIHVVVEDDGQL